MNQKGFTLLELIATIVLLTVVAGMAFIGSKGLRDTMMVKGAARQVYSEMHQARMKAIKEGKRLKIDFESVPGSYQVAIIDAGGALLDVLKSADLTDNYPAVQVCDADDAIFNANGTANNGGIYLTLGGKTKRVFIRSTGTGNMSIVDGTCP